ncbi:hypothetical protein DQ04_13721000 [Trypanosoma grayi]|uniref:hypothetical protein n=1 Tax=Trypanosoma grayi TaxID=71804 RepID=UPI0004F46A9D|nr:hypothetical protein DQ04_13721000 [Trypanosoma grayi]KEG06480.1 hypothetical protein DQ04_13721000 [Trypanosoma grayi]
MAIDARTRSGGAVRTATIWMTLFLLLQHAGHDPHLTAVAQLVTVPIERYFSRPNSDFAAQIGAMVDFSNSAEICRLGGGILSADQTPAAHRQIMSYLGNVDMGGTVYTYMGGDAMYTINWEKDPEKKCIRGLNAPSLNCLFQWNLGRFADMERDGWGVSFYRGSVYTVKGAGPVNGYPEFWLPGYPVHGQPFLINKLYGPSSDIKKTWYDGWGKAQANRDTPPHQFAVVCEVQEPFDYNTTSLPPSTPPQTTQPPSWFEKNWFVIIPIVVVPFIIALLIIILCCCGCCSHDDDDKMVVPMILREYDRSFFCAGDGNDNRGYQFYDDVVVTAPMNEWMPTDNNCNTNAAPPADTAPSVEDSTVISKTPSFKRRRSRGRTSSNVFAEISIPNGEEIKEAASEATLQDSAKTRRSSITTSVNGANDEATIDT